MLIKLDLKQQAALTIFLPAMQNVLTSYYPDGTICRSGCLDWRSTGRRRKSTEESDRDETWNSCVGYLQQKTLYFYKFNAYELAAEMAAKMTWKNKQGCRAIIHSLPAQFLRGLTSQKPGDTGLLQ